jgi:hypothetical protein
MQSLQRCPGLRCLLAWLPQEPEPMGTAGPLALAREILWNDQNIPFFVLNRWMGVNGVVV